MIDSISSLVVTFWQPLLVAAFILIGFVINLFDRKDEDRVKFRYAEMPIMKPIVIETKGKGFW